MIPAAELSGSYSGVLVTLSVMTAIISAFVALAVVPRIHDDAASLGRASIWSLVFGISLGAGIWSMHFVAMLAFHLPIPVRYDAFLTLLSLIVAVAFSTLGALPLRRGGELDGGRLLGMGVLVGSGIVGMHYTGMAAMNVAADMRFDGSIVALSVFVAVMASSVALWIANRLCHSHLFGELGVKAVAAVVMGLAVSSMHYIGMSAVHFFAQPGLNGPLTGVDTHLMAVSLIVIAALVQGGALVTAALDESRAAASRELMLQRHLGALLDAVPEAVFSIQAEGTIEHANPAATQLFGYAPDAWAGMHVQELVPEHIRDVHQQWMMDEIAGRRRDALGTIRHVQALRKDGSVFDCELSLGESVAGDGGKRFVATIRDISSRIAVEKEVRHQSQLNEALNRLLATAMEDASLPHRLQRGLDILLEQEWLGVASKGAVFECDGEQLLMRASSNMGGLTNTCEKVASGECLCGRVLQSGIPVLRKHMDDEHTVRTDGMHDHGHAIFPLHGKDVLLGVLNLYLPAGYDLQSGEYEFLASAANIMAQMLARDRTIDQMHRLELAIGQAPEGIFIINRYGCIVYGNPAIAAMSGNAVEQLVGKDAVEVCGGINNEILQREIIRCMDQGRAWQGEVEYARADGPLRIIERHIAPVIEDGEARYLVCVDRDVTEERQMHAKMQHAQRLESLGVLAGGIAHDFNNILTAVMGNAALGRSKMKGADPALKHLTRIEEASQRAADLCNQMLAYSGKGKFVVKAVNLSGMVEEITKLLDVSIAKNVVLKFHLAENLPPVEVDAAQLQQVMMNLVVNASDAIGEKSGVISLSTGLMRADAGYLTGAYAAENIEPGRFVFLEVADTGCGMDRETQEKLFDPFFTTKFTGRGLGMSAVLGIVRGHSGAIKVYSEPSKGTTFKVLLPVAGGLAVEDVEGEASTWGEWSGVGAVLIVDDEETVRETAAMMLQDMGFETLAAEDGEQALAVYRKKQGEIVAVLLDMTMPKMDGKTCFRELRRMNSDVCVILTSGYNEQDATSRFAGQGLAGFIQKPYLPETLQEKMQAILS